MKMRVLRGLIATGLLAALAACGAESYYADDASVARARYVSSEAPYIKLMTMVANRNNRGAHTAVIINGSQRVVWDPAGTWYHPSAPERNDLHYGLNNEMHEFFIDYHARVTYRVVSQTIPVSREVADLAIARFAANGAVPKAFCTNHTSTVLSQIPGFQSIRTTFYPDNLKKQFANFPGVKTRVYRDGDADDHSVLLVPRTFD